MSNKPYNFPRAEPAALTAFNSATKFCTMNCGVSSYDPRSNAEIKLLCDECLIIEVTPMTLIQALDRALQNLNEAKRINDEMQASKVHGSAPWHQHETIDGKIFDATAAIERQIEVNHQELAEQIITKKVVAGQCELSEAQLRLIGQNPVSGESRGFAEECAMQYGGVHIDADAEFIAFPRDRLIDFMGVLGYGKKE